MRTRSGVADSSAREEMQDGTTCDVFANLGCQTEVDPDSQGSSRIVNEPGNVADVSLDGAHEGVKMRKKEESALRCFIRRDMIG